MEFLSGLLEIAGNCMFRIPGIIAMSPLKKPIEWGGTIAAIVIVMAVAVAEILFEAYKDPMREICKIIFESIAVGAIFALMPAFGGFFSIAGRVVWRIVAKQILFSLLSFGIGFIIMFIFLLLLNYAYQGGAE